jgi:hypothetical protein
LNEIVDFHHCIVHFACLWNCELECFDLFFGRKKGVIIEIGVEAGLSGKD